jgi:hypothetical protein
MLDLETMGNVPDAAIVSIGAVRFDEMLRDEFYENITLKSCNETGLTVDADTVSWWMQQSPEAFSYLQENPIHLLAALTKFSDWVGRNAEVWGNGASFDNVILSSAYRAAGLPQPWKYWNDRCYRTMAALHPGVKRPDFGTKHNALDDAKSQAIHLIGILRNGGNGS